MIIIEGIFCEIYEKHFECCLLKFIHVPGMLMKCLMENLNSHSRTFTEVNRSNKFQKCFTKIL